MFNLCDQWRGIRLSALEEKKDICCINSFPSFDNKLIDVHTCVCVCVCIYIYILYIYIYIYIYMDICIHTYIEREVASGSKLIEKDRWRQ